MKKVLVAVAVVAMAVTSASALDLLPGAQVGQYWNFEQLYVGNDLAAANSGYYLDKSDSWKLKTTGADGAFAADDIYLGDNWGVLRLNSLTRPGEAAYYSDTNAAAPGQEVTGIFYGIDVIRRVDGPGFTFLAGTGGRVDFYNEFFPTAATRFLTGVGAQSYEYSATAIGQSGGLPTYPGATEGTRVASMILDDGITGNVGETVSATFIGGFPSNGSATGYLSSILDGAPWSVLLNTNFFTPAGFPGRDALNQNSFVNTDAGAVGVGGRHGWDLFSSDPIQIAPIPEPGSLLLLGLGVVGLAVGVRRRRRS